MDAMDVKEDKGTFPLRILGRFIYVLLSAPGKAQLQQEIVREGREEIGGISAWISVGLRLEEQQLIHFLLCF